MAAVQRKRPLAEPVCELTVWCTFLPFVGASGSAATDRHQGTADVATISRNMQRICDTLQP
jgi:hypothetical protein